MEPDDAWTGESLWSDGAYVALGPGGNLVLDVNHHHNGPRAMNEVRIVTPTSSI